MIFCWSYADKLEYNLGGWSTASYKQKIFAWRISWIFDLLHNQARSKGFRRVKHFYDFRNVQLEFPIWRCPLWHCPLWPTWIPKSSPEIYLAVRASFGLINSFENWRRNYNKIPLGFFFVSAQTFLYWFYLLLICGISYALYLIPQNIVFGLLSGCPNIFYQSFPGGRSKCKHRTDRQRPISPDSVCAQFAYFHA